jgi:hypothetical protein
MKKSFHHEGHEEGLSPCGGLFLGSDCLAMSVARPIGPGGRRPHRATLIAHDNLPAFMSFRVSWVRSWQRDTSVVFEIFVVLGTVQARCKLPA